MARWSSCRPHPCTGQKMPSGSSPRSSTPTSKPVVIALMGSDLVEEARLLLHKEHIPAFPFPERAAGALSALVKRADMLSKTRRTLTPTVQETQQPVSNKTPEDPIALLTDFGTPTAPLLLAGTASEAASHAAEIGFPVVMKIASPDILHKSDVEGVMLGLQSTIDVKSAFAKMMENARRHRPEARLEGVTLQRQIPNGQDVILGMSRDAVFGPLMMFGSGGIEVEGLRTWPSLWRLSSRRSSRIGAKNLGRPEAGRLSRHPPADEAAVVDVLVKLSCPRHAASIGAGDRDQPSAGAGDRGGRPRCKDDHTQSCF